MQKHDKRNEEATENTEVLMNVGALEATTKKLKKLEDEDCDLEPTEVANWITTLGKAILAIWK